jgi:NtrC-family two-component system response regulator AlgB
VLAATNRNLETEIAAGRFREDLFYRLNVIEVTLPPLRQRTDDILPMAEHLLRFFARQNGKAVSGFNATARTVMIKYSWPGNIRELRNAVERGVILASGPFVELSDLPSQIGSGGRTPALAAEAMTLEQIEADHIRQVLESTGTIEEAAAKLGIDPSTLYRKRKKYDI